MDAIIKPWPKNNSSAATETPLSDHVRAAPQPVHPRPSREDAETMIRQARGKAGWVTEAELAPPAAEAVPEEAPQPQA